MTSERTFFEFVAEVLGVSPESLSFETTYGSIPSWDSMAHLRLVMEGAARYGVEIPFADVVSVTSLWEFYRRFTKRSPKKVIAVDLDNTLWDGVIGEDGVEAIQPKVDFLATLKALKNRGILLVALSKNNEEDALKGLEKLSQTSLISYPSSSSLGLIPHPSSLELIPHPFSKDDFVTWRIDWNEKADNLRAVAAELNLGTEAFVFVDDNPAERLKMKTLLPDVAVAQFPPNLAAYFPEGEVTEEDRRKTEEYRAEAQRKRLARDLAASSSEASLSAQLFAQALGVWVKVHELAEGEIARVAQLSQKANQFNVCTARLTEDDVRRLASDGCIVTCQAGDSFSDQGLVAFAVVVPEADGCAAIAEWVMSCRVTGRGIEERFQSELERIAAARGIRELTATWKNSGKNAPVRTLFDRLGYRCVHDARDVRSYQKNLERHISNFI